MKSNESNVKHFKIEELQQMKNISDTVFTGIKASNSWTNGKAVTESEFDKAVKDFLNSPIKGKKGVK